MKVAYDTAFSFIRLMAGLFGPELAIRGLSLPLGFVLFGGRATLEYQGYVVAVETPEGVKRVEPGPGMPTHEEVEEALHAFFLGGKGDYALITPGKVLIAPKWQEQGIFSPPGGRVEVKEAAEEGTQ